MTLPGPSGIPWAGELLLFAGLALGLGELVRLQLRDRVPFVRDLDLIERGLLDVYLGGAALYLLAALPIGAFDPIGVAGMVALLVAAAIVRRRQHPMLPRIRELAERALETLRLPAYFVTLGAVLALFAIEVWVATSEATGNTYDASLFALYSSLLLQSHTLPLTLAPVTSIAVAYPQGTTVWFSAA
ncbi:MAG: actin family protein, partial [Thermoplasmata archaeon]|nr:actin family protein [Thermoplasmata archaeon]